MNRSTWLLACIIAAGACGGGDADVVMRTDGALPLTEPIGSESNQNACFSPDGSFLVFTRFSRGYNRGPAHLFRLDLVPGAIPVRLTDGDFDDVNVPYGCFDPSGRVIFASDREDANDLWTVNPDPDDLRLTRLTGHGAAPVWIEPVFSPDGASVAFESSDDITGESKRRAEIITLEVATGNAAQLTNMTGALDDRLPSWSPDGSRVLFQRRDPAVPDSLELWHAMVIDTDGQNPTNISALAVVDAPGPDTDLSWTPDGRHILTSTNPNGAEQPNIYLLPVAGGPLIRATNSEQREDGAACASPNGRSIAFESHRTASEDSPSDLWIIDMPQAAQP